MADTIDIKPDTTYAVRLTRPVRAGPVRLLPRSKITVKGRLLAQIIAEHGSEVAENVTPTSA